MLATRQDATRRCPDCPSPASDPLILVQPRRRFGSGEYSAAAETAGHEIDEIVGGEWVEMPTIEPVATIWP